MISLNLTPVRAQDLTEQRAAFTCLFCRRPGPAQIEPQAGRWKTWVLSSGSQFRPPAPPYGLAQHTEVKDLITRASRRDAAALNAISFWDSGPPGYRWNEIATNLLVKNNFPAPRRARLLSLLNVAITVLVPSASLLSSSSPRRRSITKSLRGRPRAWRR